MSDSHYTESWLTGPQNTHFYTRTYLPSSPSKAVIVFVHGFAEHIARYDHIFPTWSSRGIAVFAYDQRGFGRTAMDKEHKSKDSAWGKTSQKEQLEDVAWAVGHAKQTFAGAPVFLYGHSMGGALVLAFPTRAQASPSKEAVTSISGVIATSPLILQTKPAEQGHAVELSHDSAVGEAYLKDPLIKLSGSLRGLSDMLSGGEELLARDHTLWPKQVAYDQITSWKASEKFHGLLPVEDKTFSPYANGFHELHNEPDGVKEKLTEECITWVEAHLPQGYSSKL
ncbi:alpha beta-hydrolase [Chiua virens]|nr:alpha beta-hydrolase [Chiua virens]